MHRHAKGLTDQEIVALAGYFYRQPRHPSVLPPAAKSGADKP
jgi:cytochrome c553